MTKIKLCGLRKVEEIKIVNQWKPDMIGFVFARESKRYVDSETAALLKRNLDPAIRAVGVFVNEDADKIVSLLESGVIDLAQLHGNEDASYLKKLREKTKKPLI